MHIRYSATHGHTPQETATATTKRTPLTPEQLPAGWPDRGKVEFIRFIRSDQAPRARPYDRDARRQRLPVRHRHTRPRPTRQRAQPAHQQRPGRTTHHRTAADPRSLIPPTGAPRGRDRVGAGLTPAPPTPPGVRVRTGRFARHPGSGGRARRTLVGPGGSSRRGAGHDGGSDSSKCASTPCASTPTCANRGRAGGPARPEAAGDPSRRVTRP